LLASNVDNRKIYLFQAPPPEAPQPVKNRLGVKSRLGSKLSNRVGEIESGSRLGSKLSNRVGEILLSNNEKVEIFECSDDEDGDELNSEEELLRADAIKTIDLRKRLSATKNQVKYYLTSNLNIFSRFLIQIIVCLLCTWVTGVVIFCVYLKFS
jgi:hypothetical protein